MDRIVIVGAGGHGRECIDIARRAHRHDVLLEVVDDDPGAAARLAPLGVEYLGTTAAFGQLVDGIRRGVVVAMGLPSVRRSVVQRVREVAAATCTEAALVDPAAVVSEHFSAGPGLVVFPHAFVSTNVEFGQHCHLNVGAAVSHDCVLGEFVTLSPGVMLNGAVTVGNDVFFGTRAVVLPGLTIGDGAVIGAGAVVTTDVLPGQTLVGVPARPATARSRTVE